jgi:dipeptidyl-peptidase-4
MKKITLPFRLIFLFVILAIVPAFVFGQNANESLLTIDRIFNSDDFSAKGIGAVRWLKSGNAYAKIEPSATIKGGSDLVSYEAESGTRTILIQAEKLVPKGEIAPLALQSYEFSADDRQVLIYTNSKKVWRQNTRGDYWVLDIESGRLAKLGGAQAKPSTLMFAKFSPDGKTVGYVRENNLYVENLVDNKITRLTADGSPTLINGTSDWVNEEEFSLRDCWRWSPDSRSIAFWQFDASGIKDFTLVNNTDELYPKTTVIPYPKVGTTNAAVRIGVVSASGGQIKWLNTPGDLRQNYIVAMDWAGNSDEIVLQHLNRLQNTDQLMFADAKTGNARTILTDKDDAWVNVRTNKFSWLDNGKRFLWMSEQDGWQHLYTFSRDGSNRKLITPGNFDVVSIQAIDEANNWVYYIASPDNATQRYLYRARLDGSGAAERVTPDSKSGTNAYNISPNARWAFHTRTATRIAPQIELVDLIYKKSVRQLVDNSELQAKVDKLRRGADEFFQIEIGGATLDGWMMKPPDFDPTKKYPILFYVYGEPASQTVVDSWDARRSLWHAMLAQQGYIVSSIDNRGTPTPKGRVWRKSIYRKIGTVVSDDQASAAKALIAKHSFIDASRVGIWGWSGGGTTTLNAIFRYPEIYKTGIAVAPVPDLRLYDTIYQERYMGLPEGGGEEFYKQSSPITYADNLKGNLLIVHGTGDDNVHYQGTERLINKLIAGNKTFSMMAYPNRTHGISEGENTTRHLYTLLTDFLKRNLPADAKK